MMFFIKTKWILSLAFVTIYLFIATLTLFIRCSICINDRCYWISWLSSETSRSCAKHTLRLFWFFFLFFRISIISHFVTSYSSQIEFEFNFDFDFDLFIRSVDSISAIDWHIDFDYVSIVLPIQIGSACGTPIERNVRVSLRFAYNQHWHQNQFTFEIVFRIRFFNSAEFDWKKNILTHNALNAGCVHMFTDSNPILSVSDSFHLWEM